MVNGVFLTPGGRDDSVNMCLFHAIVPRHVESVVKLTRAGS